MKTLKQYINLIFFTGLVLFTVACSEDKSDEYFTPLDAVFSMDKTELEISKKGGEFVINVESNLPWRVSAKNSWITIEDGYNMGNGSFKIKAAKNRLMTTRETEVELRIDDNNKKILKITQESSDAIGEVTHYYVKVDGSAEADGLSWATATSFEKAMDEVFHGDYIHVAAGKYIPTVTITSGSASNEKDKTFEIHSNLNLIGGYPANATEGAIANPAQNETILSGLLPSGEKVYHVVTVTAPLVGDLKSTLNGFTIQDGEAAAAGGNIKINDATFERSYGGGMSIGGAIIDIINCNITNNSSLGHAPGMYVFADAKVRLENSIVQNSVGLNNGKNGGGIFNDAATIYIINSQIVGNSVSGVGGGIYSFNTNQPSYTYIYNSLISGNTAGGSATRKGGGFYGRENSITIMVNTTIQGNNAGVGSGIGMHGASGKASVLDLISCTITDNSAITKDPGYQGQTYSTINFYNSIVSGNKGGDTDGSIGKVTFKNSVFGSAVYGADNKVISGLKFDYTTMLGTLADNGGTSRTCLLLGTDNPAKANGMTSDALINLGKSMEPIVESEIVTKDQIGLSRVGKTYMGACVK